MLDVTKLTCAQECHDACACAVVGKRGTKVRMQMPRAAAERLERLWQEGELKELASLGVVNIDVVAT